MHKAVETEPTLPPPPVGFSSSAFREGETRADSALALEVACPPLLDGNGGGAPPPGVPFMPSVVVLIR